MLTGLTDENFKRLMAVRKTFVSGLQLPMEDEKKTYVLQSEDSQESFLLTIERKTIFELRRSKLNTSYSREPIFRVEVNGRPHINPDGSKIGRNHVHVYKEGFGMSWAYPLETFSPKLFKELSDFNIIFSDFCEYCNIDCLEDYQEVL